MRPTHDLGQSPKSVGFLYKHCHKLRTLGHCSPFSDTTLQPRPRSPVQIIQDQKHRVVRRCEFLKTLDNLALTKWQRFGESNSFKFLVIAEALWFGKYQEVIPTGEAELQTSQDAHLQSELPKLGFLRKWGMPQFWVILTANVLIYGKFMEFRWIWMNLGLSPGWSPRFHQPRFGRRDPCWTSPALVGLVEIYQNLHEYYGNMWEWFLNMVESCWKCWIHLSIIIQWVNRSPMAIAEHWRNVWVFTQLGGTFGAVMLGPTSSCSVAACSWEKVKALVPCCSK